MTATYGISKHELNADFIEAIKKTFKTEKVLIQIDEVMDETEYLLSTPANSDFIKKSIQQIKNGEVIKLEIEKYL
ncbi:MAG: hypothetical protein EAY66_08660 [Sphingobacteriales bacterium]|jgi:hypothetical protein|nr:MAG: hypothetical protein EAY66_08660 [Sphingobacteriales bacterium]